MNKILQKIILLVGILLIPSYVNAGGLINITEGGATNSSQNINISTENTGTDRTNPLLNTINENDEFFNVSTLGEKGIKNFILNLARDLKVVLLAIILLLGVIIVIKLIFSKGAEDDIKKLKSWIIYLTIGFILIQSSTVIYKVLFDKAVNSTTADSFGDRLLEPIINLFYTAAAFIFIFVAIVAFYKIVFAGGNEDGIKKGKQTIIQALIGFIVIKFAKIVVDNTFNPVCGDDKIIKVVGTKVCEDITQNAQVIMIILNWVNTFVGIVIIIMIIYAGFLYITSGGNEDNQKKAKNIVLYIVIGLSILISSYLILTFFINLN